MKGKRQIKKVIAAFLILLMGMSGTGAGVPAYALAADTKNLSSTYLSATLKYLNFGSKDTVSYDFDIRKDAQKKGAEYFWYVNMDKGNPDAVTINSKTGIVTAKKAGTAYIRCKITLAEGKTLRPEAKVIVRNNISEVDISNVPGNQTVTAGKSYDFNRVVVNTDAGKGKASDGVTRWELAKDKAGVGKVSEGGRVLATKKGSFDIRAVCFQSKEKYNLWLKDNSTNKKYITAASKWYTIAVADPAGESTVTNQAELDKALASKEITKVTIATADEIKFIIGKGDYSGKTIVVDAPNADVDNSAVFKNIIIKAIKENTWNENAEGNSFHVTSVKVRIVVAIGAEVNEIIFDSENSAINLEVEGIVHQVTLLQSSVLTMSGDGDRILVKIDKAGEGSTITSSIPVKIEAMVRTEIILNAGSEGSSIDKQDKSIEIKVENHSTQTVVITVGNAGEEKIEAGKSGISNGTSQPSTSPAPNSAPPAPISTPPTGGGGGGGTPSVPAVPVLQSIFIKTPATKTSYLIGERLSIEGLVVEGNYSDNTKKPETVTIANISGFDSSKEASELKLGITIGGKTVFYYVKVTKAEGPALTGVNSNDTANTLTGMTESMEFSTDKKTWTAYKAMPSNLPNLSGDIVLWVRNAGTSTHKAGAAQEFRFTKANISLESIQITMPAKKLTYLVGEELDITGLQVEGTYSDNTKKQEAVTIANISGFDSSKEASGLKLTITIGGKTVFYSVTVTKAEGSALTGVTSDDSANTLTGMTEVMELSIDGKTWTAYKAMPSNLPDLSGDIVLWVRNAGTSTHKAGAAQEFRFTKANISLESIQITMPAKKLTYLVGEELDITGLQVEGTYSDNTKKQEAVTIANISGFDSSKEASELKLTINIGGKSASYSVKVTKEEGPALTGVTSDDSANTLTGMTEAMEFSIDGNTWTTYKATPSNLPDLSGDIVLWVRNAETSTHKAGAVQEFRFTKESLGLESIKIIRYANKLTYLVGEELDITGLEIEGTYSDGSKQSIAVNTGNISGFDSSQAALSLALTITVGDKTTSYRIVVTDPVDLGPEITGVIFDDNLDTLKWVETLMEYSLDGVKWTKYAYTLPDLFGNVDIMLRYRATATKKAGPIKVFHFTKAELLSLEITKPQSKLIFYVGDALDYTGLVVTGNYSGGRGRKEPITSSNISGFDSSVEHEKLVLTIAVEDKTVTYEVSVTKAPGPVSNVTKDDALNTVDGMKEGMEFSLDGKNWTRYISEPSNLPNLQGNLTFYVRYAETATHKAGEIKTLSFYLGKVWGWELIHTGAKTTYYVGEEFDLTGLFIRTKYSDNTAIDNPVTIDQVTGFDSSKPVENQKLLVDAFYFNISIKPIPMSTVTVTGTADVDSVLGFTIAPAGAASSISCKWLKCDTKDGEYQEIPGAVSTTYTPSIDDLGKYIKAEVTGSGNYTGTIRSTATAAITETVTATHGELRAATGSAIIVLNKPIKGLTAEDIVVRKGVTNLTYSTDYVLSGLDTNAIEVTFTSNAGLAIDTWERTALFLNINKDYYLFSGGNSSIWIDCQIE